jgi:hypothetical protein
VEFVGGTEEGVDKTIRKACCEKSCCEVTTLVSEAADLARDAVNASREAPDFSIPVRDAVDPATDFPESSLSLPRAAGKKRKNISHKNNFAKVQTLRQCKNGQNDSCRRKPNTT